MIVLKSAFGAKAFPFGKENTPLPNQLCPIILKT